MGMDIFWGNEKRVKRSWQDVKLCNTAHTYQVLSRDFLVMVLLLVLLEGSLSQTNHKRKRVFKTNLSHLPTLLTLNSKDFIGKPSYCLPYN